MNIDLSRRIIGLMSGTSLDGVDAAIVRISGSGAGLSVTLEGFLSRPYPAALKQLLLENSTPATSSVNVISQLNVRLAYEYAATVRDVIRESGFALEDIDAVGCHGQTVYHVPEPVECAGLPVRSTLQLGDPSTLAYELGLTVVGDFRLADMAAGGQGAPLAAYFDYVYFADSTENRVLLNIGGIANITAIPRDCPPESVLAFDTGPGNMVIDALTKKFWDEPFDEDGRHASEGNVNQQLLASLLTDDYYTNPPPKSTGREVYNRSYVKRLIETAYQMGISRHEDIIATTSALTTETICLACDRFVRPQMSIDRVIVSGGGVHNQWIMRELANRLSTPVVSSTDMELNADAKEAMFFAVLAHETLNGVPSNMPHATGARKPAILGKICLPPPFE